MKISLKILSLILTVSTLFSVTCFYSSAQTKDDLEKELENLENKIAGYDNLLNSYDSSLASAETKIDSLSDQLAAYDREGEIINGQIDVLNGEISALNSQINEVSAKITSLENEIAKIDNEISTQKKIIDETYQVLKKRIRADYMAGETSELEMFLNAGSFQDFITRSEMVRRVAKHDKEVVKSLEEQISSLNNMIEDLEKKRAELEDDKKALDGDKASLDTKMQDLQVKKARIDKNRANSQAAINKQNELIGSLNEKSKTIERLKKQAETQAAQASRELDAFVSNNGSSGSGEVINNEPTSHNFRKSSKGIISPLQDSTAYYSCRFAEHSSRGTASVDLCAPGNRVYNGKSYYTTKGAKIYAVASGKVIKSTYTASGYGNHIIIDHGNGLSSLYAHCDARYVNAGDTVKQGQVIGLVGNTGNCWPRPSASNPVAGSHLHFEMRINGTRTNPENYLPSPLV